MRFSVSWVLHCMRWSYLKCFMPDRERFDRRLVKKGRRAEEQAKREFSYMKIRRGRNRELYFKNYTLVGRPDFLTREAVLEIKSGRPSYSYILPGLIQLNLYMLMEGKRTGLLIFIGENTKVIHARFSTHAVRQGMAYFDALWEHIQKGVIPEGQPVCNSCSFAHVCGGKYVESL